MLPCLIKQNQSLGVVLKSKCEYPKFIINVANYFQCLKDKRNILPMELVHV